MEGKTIIEGKIRIVSPVHIGGAQEKHLQRGLDYIVADGKAYFLDDRKLIAHFGIDAYSNALSENKITELCKTLTNLQEYSKKVVKSISGEIGTDIKTNIKNVLSEKPIIPGSSLKGALRSVFVNKLGGARVENDRNNKPKTIEPFGQIQEDVNRYMIVGDTEFNTCTFMNTKTFNLQNGRNIIGGWKHTNNTNDKFDNKGFTFPHEVIATDDFGTLNIVFNKSALQNALNSQKYVTDPRKNIVKTGQKIEEIYLGSQEKIFKIIQEYTKTFLQKEISFFNKFETDQTSEIVEYYKNLLVENEKTPILRVGLGSGFHSMTGDPYDSHDIDEINRRGKYRGKDSAKSRKIAFSGSGDNLRLYPMGFVQLMTNEYYDQNYKKQHEERLQHLQIKNEQAKQFEKEQALKVQEQIENNKITEKQRVEAEIKAKEDALKPKMIEALLLRKAKWVDGIVVGQNGKMLQFKPFVVGFEEKVFEISYSSGMPIDTVIQVMCLSPNGKILQFQGSPKKKEV